jgi:predicted outer membrane repeat protein
MWAYEPDSIIIKQSTFKNNTSHGGWQGGAALMVISGCDAGHCRYGSQPEPGTFLIEDSSFIGNTADTNGGAIAVGCSGPCNINNSTFYGNNITGGDGSAVFATANSWPGDPGIQFNGVTFAHNGDGEGNSTLSGSNFVINNTVFESSGQKLCSDTNTGSNVLEFVPAGSKGSSSTTHCIPGVPAIIQSDPFPSIADNGGPTFTAMPSMSTGGSQLVGAGSGCLSTDQRGATRNTAKCTLGAVE